MQSILSSFCSSIGPFLGCSIIHLPICQPKPLHNYPVQFSGPIIDITVKLGEKNIAGIAVKFVMSNYSQNNVNYFENMLGETANIRSAQIQYFQIFIIPDSVPYYNRDRRISKWEFISSHNLAKYQKLSEDNIDNFMHTPNKTLIFIIHLPKIEAKSEQEYKEFFLQNKGFEITTSQQEFDFGDRVIYNDYELFMQKVVFSIKSI